MKKFAGRAKTILPALLIVAAGFIVYVNSINNSFVWDDNVLIKNNFFIKSFCNILKIFTKDIGLYGQPTFILYRPVQMLTFMFDYGLWRYEAYGYHLTNIILHILTALVLYRLIIILFRDRLLGFVTSILFVMHPVHTEAVTYISGRAGPLAALFMLITIILYIGQNPIKTGINYVLMLLCYAISLLSMECAIVLPLLIMLYHIAFGYRAKPKAFFGILAITLLYITLRVSVSPALHAKSTLVLAAIPGFFAAIVNYLRILILPLWLHMEYGRGVFSLQNPIVICGIILTVAMILCAFAARKRSSLVFFSISWFLINLLPFSNVYPMNAYMAEHWLYIPSIGFFLLLASSLTLLFRTKGLKAVGVVIFTGILIFYSLLTIRQNGYWKDPVEFYKRALIFSPASPRIYNNLAYEYANINRYDEAIRLYKESIRLDPSYALAYKNMGVVYEMLGDRQEAMKCYREALKIRPRFTDVHNMLGMLYYSMGKKGEAMELFTKAFDIDPNSAQVCANIANLYSEMGSQDKAVDFYRRSLDIDPENAEVYNDLAIAYASCGKISESIDASRRAIAIDPDFAIAHMNLAMTYYYSKRYDLAVEHYDRAVELGCAPDPKFSEQIKAVRK